jgi:hypothetical protein
LETSAPKDEAPPPEERNVLRRIACPARRSVAVALVLSAAGCSLVLKADADQCQTDGDCVDRGFVDAVCIGKACQRATDTAWACVGSVKWPSTGSGQVALTLQVVDVVASAPPTGLAIRACSKLDTNCTNPLQSSFTQDAQGRFVVMVSAGFEGYLELTTPTNVPPITPALFFPIRPVFTDTTVPNPVPVVSTQGFQQIAAAIGTTLDLETSGHVYALASDCTDVAASGAHFTLDKQGANTSAYYMINGTPVGTAPATDVSGAGGFLNVQPGFANLTSSVSVTGARIGQSSFVVRAGAVSYPRVLPTP